MTEMKFTKEAIINFFDPLAEGWDDHKKPDFTKVNLLLDNAAVTEGKTVLDVACGTGILAPLLLERKVASVVGVDIAPEMIRIAQEKHHHPNFTFLAGDVEELDFEQKFDILEVIGVVMSLGLIPISLRGFKKTVSRIAEKQSDSKVKFYMTITLLRLFAFFVVIEYGIVMFYLVNDTIGLYCAVIGFFCSLFCFPSVGQVESELGSEE